MTNTNSCDLKKLQRNKYIWYSKNVKYIQMFK